MAAGVHNIAFIPYNSICYMEILMDKSSPLQWNASSANEAAAYLPFGFRFAFGLALSAFNAAKGWSSGSGGVTS